MEFGSFMEFDCREGLRESDAFQAAFAHVDLAEEMGLDAVWLAELHFLPNRSVLSAPLIVASAVAARTKRIRVGTAVHVLPLGHPLRIAEEVATLDHVSQGRLEFGVGRSAIPEDFEGYNLSLAESRERFAEYLDIIIQAWTQERLTYRGKFFHIKNVCVIPKPYQHPHPPIRVAATTSETFPAIGRMGFPIFIGLRIAGLSQVAGQVNSYQEGWKEAGHKGSGDVSLRIPVYVAQRKAAAISEPEESFIRQFRRLGRQLSEAAAAPGADPNRQKEEFGRLLETMTWEEIRRERVCVGTPEMVVEQLSGLKERLGLGGVVAEFNAGEILPRERVASSLRLFCEEVLPHFK